MKFSGKRKAESGKLRYFSPLRQLADGSKNISRGFTLIEILVAITIVGLVSTIAISGFNQAQLLARDSKRKTDLRNIAQALEIYYQTNGRYPCTSGGNWLWSTSGDNWITDTPYSGCGGTTAIPFDSKYISQVPKDPKNTANPFWTTGNFVYGYRENCVGTCGCPESLNGKYFVIGTRLENANDPDGKIKVKECNGNEMAWPDGVFAVTSKLR